MPIDPFLILGSILYYYDCDVLEEYYDTPNDLISTIVQFLFIISSGLFLVV